MAQLIELPRGNSILSVSSNEVLMYRLGRRGLSHEWSNMPLTFLFNVAGDLIEIRARSVDVSRFNNYGMTSEDISGLLSAYLPADHPQISPAKAA